MHFRNLRTRAKLAICTLTVAFIGLSSTQSFAATLNPGFTYNSTTNVLTDGNSGGLSWLNLNETRGRSYDDISDKLDQGEEFSGYRYATGAEVNTLIGNWVGYALNAGITNHNDDLIDDLINFIGDVYGDKRNVAGDSSYSVNSDGFTFGSSSTDHQSYGIIADVDPNNPSLHFVGRMLDWAEKWTNQSDYSNAFDTDTHRNYVNINYGSFLVETQVSVVPLPAAFPLYGAGLAVMGFIGWRRKRKA